MSGLRIHDEQQLPWITPSDRLPPAELEALTEGERTVRMAVRELGTADQPQLLEIKYQPGARIKPHAHAEDEIVFVREGELHLGTRVLKAGDSMFIARRSFYSFQAGPEGLTILNFRPRKDETYYELGKGERKSVL